MQKSATCEHKNKTKLEHIFFILKKTKKKTCIKCIDLDEQ